MLLPNLLRQLSEAGFLVDVRDAVQLRIYHEWLRADEPGELAKLKHEAAALGRVLAEIQIIINSEMGKDGGNDGAA